MMLDLQEHLEEAFATTSVWDDEASFFACRLRRQEQSREYSRRRSASKKREPRVEQLREWHRTHKNEPERKACVRSAQSRYEQQHPERVKASQAAYAPKKWAKTKNEPDRLERRRAYQRTWAKERRARA